MGNQRNIVDGVFLVGAAVGDHGSDGGLATCSSRGGHSEEWRQGFEDFKLPLHLGRVFLGRTHRGPPPLAKIHGGPTAKAPNPWPSFFFLFFKGLLVFSMVGLGTVFSLT